MRCEKQQHWLLPTTSPSQLTFSQSIACRLPDHPPTASQWNTCLGSSISSMKKWNSKTATSPSPIDLDVALPSIQRCWINTDYPNYNSEGIRLIASRLEQCVNDSKGRNYQVLESGLRNLWVESTSGEQSWLGSKGIRIGVLNSTFYRSENADLYFSIC